MRPSQRLPDQLRPLTIERNFTRHAEGSVLIRMVTHTCWHRQCRGKRAALPARQGAGLGHGRVRHAAALHPTRSAREAAKGKQTGRTQEIQRLIGRSLRAIIDLKALGERQITL